MYKMELKTNAKILLINMDGFMTQEEIISFIEEFKNNLKDIISNQYSIVVDSRELKAFPQQLLGNMKEAMSLITITPFKKLYTIMPKSLITTMQIKRVGMGVKKLNDIINVESYEEILESIA